MKTYVTFGQIHTHSVNGITFDKDCVAVIEADTASAGRDKAFSLFGRKFCTTYTDATYVESIMKHFPRGYIEVGGA